MKIIVLQVLLVFLFISSNLKGQEIHGFVIDSKNETPLEYANIGIIDLSDFNILVSGNVVMSIEWIGISNVIEKNLIKMNGAKVVSPNVLFDLNQKHGTFYIRNGSEAKWRILENRSPGFYLTVKG